AIDLLGLAQGHAWREPAGRVALPGRIREVHVPVNGVQEEGFRRPGDEGTNMPVDVLRAVPMWKDMTPVRPLQLPVEPCPHTGGVHRRGWCSRTILPQLEIALETMGDPEFVRHPAIGTDAERVIVSLMQDFWKHRIAMRV